MKNIFVFCACFFIGSAMASDFSASIVERYKVKGDVEEKYSRVCDEYLSYIRSNKNMSFCWSLTHNFKKIKSYQWHEISVDQRLNAKREIVDFYYKDFSVEDRDKMVKVSEQKKKLEQTVSEFDYDNDGQVETIYKAFDTAPSTCNNFPKYQPPNFGYKILPSLQSKNARRKLQNLDQYQPFNYEGKNFTVAYYYAKKNTGALYINYPTLSDSDEISSSMVCKISVKYKNE